MPVTLADPPSLPALTEPTTVFETTLGPGQAFSLQTAGLQDLQVGYARFLARPSVGATAVFTSSNTSTGATLYDAGVPSITRPLRRFTIFLDSLEVRDTGLAMVRVRQSDNSIMTRGAANKVRLRLFDTAFNQIAAPSSCCRRVLRFPALSGSTSKISQRSPLRLGRCRVSWSRTVKPVSPQSH